MTIQLCDKGVRCVLKRVNGIKPNNRAVPSRYRVKVLYLPNSDRWSTKSLATTIAPQRSRSSNQPFCGAARLMLFIACEKLPHPRYSKEMFGPYMRDNLIILSIEGIRHFCSVSMYLSNVFGTFQLCSTRKSCMVACHEHYPCLHKPIPSQATTFLTPFLF